MGSWEYLPAEALAHVFSYLPRRDRLSCSLVCQAWKNGLNHMKLWKTIVVYIDKDLMEPSTILLLRDYCKYVKNLEFGWSVSNKSKLGPVVFKELTKRAVRFFLILHDNFTQIHKLKISNWLDFTAFQKITYHLSRFLKVNFTKMMTACLSSKTTITYLDLHNCDYCQYFDAVYFRSCIEELSYLKTFKLDYYILACNLIDSIVTSRNRCLENLELVLGGNRVISNDQWRLLNNACPNLKVKIISNVYSDLERYLAQSIPLVAFSVTIPRSLNRETRYNFLKTLHLLIITYYKTLVYLDVRIRNDVDILDEVLTMAIKKYSRLKTLAFNGVLENPELLNTCVESE
ncbi:F-box only protein 39 [Asbolus verrucosus]|uniref:F-box only protein 39 n=1 Tax=Asbolus verrucosus TaxID=1661398 RepID=A0A482VIA5_ASBVE|nr:F-box only protein 39 [Asbolus verrucosus]